VKNLLLSFPSLSKNDMAKREGGSINVGSKNCGKERRS
jgi:hypothetical protein